jgi:hypothetical protein
MKYLKPFNESKENLKDELKDFCETSLAYLYDDGYDITLSVRDKVKYPGVNHIVVSLGLNQHLSSTINSIPSPGDNYALFSWNDVKDYYIPFIQMLVKRYELLPYLGTAYLQFNTEMGFQYLSLDQVINDRVSQQFGCRLWGINLKISDKI